MRCNSRGISLIEVVIYVALLGMIAVFTANSLISIVNTYARARAEREVLNNARSVLELVTNTIAESQEIYTSTSRFNDNAGQLSLLTSATSTAGHVTAYTDIWVDGGAALMRLEGKGTLILSAASVRVTALRFERIIQALGREAIKTIIKVEGAGAKFPASSTLNATTALRGNY